MPFTAGDTPFGAFDSDPQFQADADKMVTFIRRKLGSPVIETHLSSSQIYAAFEEAALEFSQAVNAHQAKNVLGTFLGSPTGSLSGAQNTFVARNMELERMLAESAGEEAYLNGSHPLYSASIDVQAGVQKYDLKSILSGTGVLTGSNANARVRVKELFHFSPLSAFRFFGTTSAVNYLHNQFSFESFTPETIFYLLPVWEDILRGMQFETSNRVRRSNYSYELHDNVVTLYPAPSQDTRLFLTYQLPPDALADSQSSRSFNGVANLSNIPFGNISYSKVNSIGKSWIRRMTFALAKEVEGQIRSKFSTIPIPNAEVTLNGPELIADARNEMDILRQELKDVLDETSYQALMARDAEMHANAAEVLRNVPMLIFVG